MLSSVEKLKELLIILAIVVYSQGKDVTNLCEQQCRLVTNSSSADYSCGSDTRGSSCHQLGIEDRNNFRCDGTCRQNQCSTGCSRWQDALQSSCDHICNGTAVYLVQPCVAGCSIGVKIYAAQLAESLGELIAPGLAGPEAVSNTSVILTWMPGRTLTTVQYAVEQQMTETSDIWEPCEDVAWMTEKQLKVEGLHPHVIYQFRIAVIITDEERLYSNASIPIATLPYGTPASPPEITELVSWSPTAIKISWKAPQFTNGPLLAYHLQVTSLNSSDLPKVKDVPVRDGMDNAITEVITLLQPGMLYNVSLTARNRFGLGPSISRNITTQPKEQDDDFTPYMIFGAENSIVKLDMRDSYYEYEKDLHYTDTNIEVSQVLYSNVRGWHDIRDVAVHIHRGFIFFSDDSGAIHRLSYNQPEKADIVYQSNRHPSALAVDWLHDKFYLVEETQIVQCGLNGESCRTAINKVIPTAEDIQVDPGNGYLYWVQHGPTHGIYRIDLADLEADPVLHSPDLLIVKLDLVSSFTIDPMNFRLYFPDESQNTMLSSYIDGSDIINVRPNNSVQSPHFIDIKSLAAYDGVFYWTDGQKMMSEHYSDENKLYYHNEMPLFYEHLTGINMWHPSAQPIPVPPVGPSGLSVLFTDAAAALQWSPPELGKGRGAWQDWKYEVRRIHSYKDDGVAYNDTHIFRELDRTHQRLEQLQPNSSYSFQVRAYSQQDGYGPWSDTFRGQTLHEASVTPVLLVADDQFIYKVNLDGSRGQNIFDLSKVNGKVIDMAVYGNRLFFNLKHGDVYELDLSGRPRRLNHIQEAFSIAYEPLAGMIYWAHHTYKMILRSKVEVATPEVVYRGVEAPEDMVIDSMEGYIYWSTLYSVQVAHLNGNNRQNILELKKYSFKFVLGLTLDFDHNKLYFIIKEDRETTLLYQTPLLSGANGRVQPVELVLSHPQAPLHQGLNYYSNRLFWMGNEGLTVMMNSRVQSNAVIGLTSVEKVAAFVLQHPSTNRFQVGNVTLQPESVTPDQINTHSLGVVGTWDNFTVSWDPTPAAHSQVFYEIELIYDGLKKSMEPTTSAFITVETMRPYTHVTMALKSCTHWVCSPVVHKVFFTPMAKPSTPEKPRTFVTYIRTVPLRSEYRVDVELHWSRPQELNGLITSYTVFLADSPEGSWLQHEDIKGDSNFLKIGGAQFGKKYYFRVDACTPVGCSEQTDIVVADTLVENPVPTLLTASDTSVDWFYPDVQKSSSFRKGQVIALTFVALEQTFYWLDMTNHIIKNDGTEIREILDVNGTGKSIAVDWIGRDLYWIEEESRGKFSIKSYDLNRNNRHSNTIMQRDYSIGKVAVNPYDSAIYWSENDASGKGHIMHSLMDGRQVSSLFYDNKIPKLHRRKRVAQHTCNCPSMSVSNVFDIDHSKKDLSELYVVEGSTGSIWASDPDGCMCRLVVNGTGVAADSLAVDHQRLYWSNEKEKVLYSVDKRTGQGLVRDEVGDIKQIIAYGSHLQPLPDLHCLVPSGYQDKPQLKARTSSSLILQLAPWYPVQECQGISLPTTTYTVHYRKLENPQDTTSCTDEAVTCLTKPPVYDLEVLLDQLEPYAFYLVQVSVGNYYTTHRSNLSAEPPGTPVIFRTQEGVPSPARDVQTSTLSPEKIRVLWQPPLHPHSAPEDVLYHVKWRTNSVERGHLEVTSDILMFDQKKMLLYTDIEALRPQTVYNFSVLAYDKYKKGHSSSTWASAETYHNPGQISMLDHGSDYIQIEWQSPSDDSVFRHTFEISEVSRRLLQGWRKADKLPIHTENHTTYNHTFVGLKSRTEYVVRISVIYKSGEKLYWPHDHRYTFKTAALGEPDDLTVALGSTFATISVLVLLISVFLFITCRKTRDHKSVPLDFVNQGRRNDVELATLRELPRVATQQTNALYAINGPEKYSSYSLIGIVPTEEDIASLPHFGRHQLILTKFLGSGAFGEVFEGLAANILSEDSGNTKVAVKTLRKGASDQEKEEFLKEALLMSNFKHAHIISLLGVCLDNDPQFIILELMEGGDLLSYLRGSRPSPTHNQVLELQDMVHICVDVARGCKYLEDMHFVHRDLAARNCLVSSKDPAQSVVKIGDFGLARDIYKNDYYRKEGEGLLPVRWMSPESLVDGVFTTHSDIWAFGVLMWEVLTLGQQPYPARTNIEVLHYVRNGGRLDRPDNCPDEMYQLMLKCWHYTPDDRPTFYLMLDLLLAYKVKVDSEMPLPRPRGLEFNATLADNDSLQSFVIPSSSQTSNVYLSMSGRRSENEGLEASGTSPGQNYSLGRRSCQSTDSQGYLRPLATHPRPKYLELLAEGDLGLRGQGDGAISPPITYADLSKNTIDSDLDSDNPSAINSDAVPLAAAPEAPGIIYAELDRNKNGLHPPVQGRPPPSPASRPQKPVVYSDIVPNKSGHNSDLDLSRMSRSNSSDLVSRSPRRPSLRGERSPSTSLDSLLAANVPSCSSWQDMQNADSDCSSWHNRRSPSNNVVLLPPPMTPTRSRSPSPLSTARPHSNSVSEYHKTANKSRMTHSNV